MTGNRITQRGAAMGLALALAVTLSACSIAGPGEPQGAPPSSDLAPIAAELQGPSDLAPIAAEETPAAELQGPSDVPGSVFEPEAAYWEDAEIAPGYRLTLVQYAGDAGSPLSMSVAAFAREHAAELTVVILGAERPDITVQAVAEQSPDIIVGAGTGIADVFDAVSATNLDQLFLVLGAQLPEPTENVAAVVWPGSSTRGLTRDTLTPISGEDPEATTARLADTAMRAGIASIARGDVGHVLALAG